MVYREEGDILPLGQVIFTALRLMYKKLARSACEMPV
jgi:hypothetical protein